MSEDVQMQLEPLGVFGFPGDDPFALDPDQLRGLSNSLSKSERRLVADYLRSGALIIAVMEYTRDVLEGAFGVPGGTAVWSDGRYYWRGDAVEYVEHYGIAVGEDAVNYMASLNWQAPTLSEAEILDLDGRLLRIIRRK